MADTVYIVTEVTTAELAALVSGSLLNTGLQYKNTETLKLYLATSSNSYVPIPQFRSLTCVFSQVLIEITSGLLEEGKTYVINQLESGDNFINVGYLAPGVMFVATGTTPSVWSNGTVVKNISDTLVTTIFDDTLNCGTWQYGNKGNYFIDTNIDFAGAKFYCSGQSDWSDQGTPALPLLNGNNLVGGYYFIFPSDNNSGKMVIRLMIITPAGTANSIDLNDIIGESVLYIPEIRVYY